MLTSEPDPQGVLAITGLLLLADNAFEYQEGLLPRRRLHEAARRCAGGPTQRPRVTTADPLGVAWQVGRRAGGQGDELIALRCNRLDLVTGSLLRQLDAIHAEQLSWGALAHSRRCWDELAQHWACQGAAGTAALRIVCGG